MLILLISIVNPPKREAKAKCSSSETKIMQRLLKRAMKIRVVGIVAIKRNCFLREIQPMKRNSWFQV
jgi:hypothetical protein